MEKNVYRWIIAVAKFVVSIAFLYVVISKAKSGDYTTIISILSPTTIAGVIAIVVFQMALISAWRLKLTLQLFACRIGVIEAARITWSGFFFEQIGAVFIAGDLLRIWLLRQANVPLSTAIKGTLLDRAIGFGTIVILASLGAPRVWWGLSEDQRDALLFVVGASTVFLAVCASLAMIFLNLRSRALHSVVFLRDHMVSTIGTAIRTSRRLIFAVVLLAFSTHALNVVAVYLLLNAVGADLDLTTCFVFVPTVLLISMLPISLSGWGIREGAMAWTLQNFNVPFDHVLAASVLFGICVIVASLPGAFIWLANFRSLNRVSSH